MLETAKTIFAGLGIWFLASLLFGILLAVLSNRFRRNQGGKGNSDH